MAGGDAASSHQVVVVACHIAALVHRFAADSAADMRTAVHHIVAADGGRADDTGLDRAAAAAAAADRVDVVGIPADILPHSCLHHQMNRLFCHTTETCGSEKNRTE